MIDTNDQRDILCKEDCAVGCLKEVISMHSCSCHIGRQSVDQFTYLLQQYPIINPIDYKLIEFVSIMIHVYNLAARMRSPDLRWTMGRMTLKCIYTFAVTFSKMEKLVKFLILH